jgi:hypothetical protein
MKEIFKDVWAELPTKVRIITAIIFLLFIALCIWASVGVKGNYEKGRIYSSPNENSSNWLID